ncbi:MAG: PQ-loop repeat-containing protein [Patescibacteria group bacterium]|nr:PQ-loop repeat-containing protein [Patescibacteria group bacterium]
MTFDPFLIIGIAGNTLEIIAYMPQIRHLYKEKNSTGVSLGSWMTWLVGDLLLLIYAIHLMDPVFIMLTSFYMLFQIWGIILIIRFKPKA